MLFRVAVFDFHVASVREMASKSSSGQNGATTILSAPRVNEGNHNVFDDSGNADLSSRTR